MSVAFRREGDDEHKEPVFELPIPPGPNLVTRQGLAQIEARVAELESAARAAPDDEAAKPIRRELRYWRTRLATAELQPPFAGDAVGFGATVRFRLNGAERTVTLVGDDEANPAAGRLAWSAPLARALMGAEVGERVDFAGREEAVEVLAVSDGLPSPS